MYRQAALAASRSRPAARPAGGLPQRRANATNVPHRGRKGGVKTPKTPDAGASPATPTSSANAGPTQGAPHHVKVEAASGPRASNVKASETAKGIHEVSIKPKPHPPPSGKPPSRSGSSLGAAAKAAVFGAAAFYGVGVVWSMRDEKFRRQFQENVPGAGLVFKLLRAPPLLPPEPASAGLGTKGAGGKMPLPGGKAVPPPAGPKAAVVVPEEQASSAGGSADPVQAPSGTLKGESGEAQVGSSEEALSPDAPHPDVPDFVIDESPAADATQPTVEAVQAAAPEAAPVVSADLPEEPGQQQPSVTTEEALPDGGADGVPAPAEATPPAAAVETQAAGVPDASNADTDASAAATAPADDGAAAEASAAADALVAAAAKHATATEAAVAEGEAAAVEEVAEDMSWMDGASEAEIELYRAKKRVAELERQLGQLQAGEAERVRMLLEDQFRATEEEVAQEKRAALAEADELAREQLVDTITNLQQAFEREMEEVRAALRDEKQLEIQQHLRVQQSAHDASLAEALEEQAAEIKEESETNLRLRLGRERAQRIQTLESLFLRLKAVEAVLSSHARAQSGIEESHTLFMAADTLMGAVGSHQSLSEQLAIVREVGSDNPVVQAVIGAVPQRAVEEGVCSLEELQAAFHYARCAARRLATVPEDGGFWSHMVSHALSWVTFERHGLVAGSDVEAVLARAQYYVQLGDVDKAAREVNQLRGAPRAAMRDWLDDARTHLEVTQALAAIRAHVSAVSLSYLP